MRRLLPVLLLVLSGCSDDVGPGANGTQSPDASFSTGEGQTQDLTVTVTSPASGAVFGQSATIEVTLTVQGPDGLASPLTLRWESDRDGTLLEEQASGTPHTTALGSLSPGTHILEVTVTDAASRQGATSLVVVMDAAPTGPTVVTLVPEEPTTTQSLEAVITTSAEDPEGGQVVYTWRWTVDGSPTDEITSAVVPSVMTSRGQLWTVTATPSDGISHGTPGTATTEILNTPPVLASAQVLPSAGGTSTPFSCQGIDWEDPDGDAEDLAFEWQVNEIPVELVSGADITGEHYIKGDVLTCTVTPSDPFEQGPPAQSDPIPIIDTPSTVEEVILEPTAGDVTTTFSCSGVGLGDLDDGDEPFLKTVWVTNDVPLPGTSSTSFEAHTLAKGDTLRCRLIPATVEADGAPLDSVQVTLGNAPPVGGSVVMEPASPTEVTGVTCVPAEPTDPDQDNVAYSYQWTVDGEVVQGEDGATLSGEHFHKGQVVSCTAIPFDGEDTGEPVTTKFTLVVGNSLPSLEEVTVEPTEGSKSDTFTCTPVGWSDPDPADSPVYTYEWRLDGEVISGGIFPTLEPAGLAPGALTCTVVPGDGEDQGDPVTSAPSLLVNHAPSITGVTLGPDPAMETSTLTCSPSGWADLDGDPPGYVFSWTVQGVQLPASDGETLTGDHFDKGHLVLCTATPTDGVAVGASHTSNPLQITNSPPSLDSAAIDPPTGGKATAFTCTPSGYQDPDQGDPELVTYTWLVDDAPIDGTIESSVVPGEAATHGAQLRCQATPFDGTEYGEPVLSGTATIINSPPLITIVTIIPQDPTELDTLSCIATLVLDLDGDDVTLGVVWTRNDAPLPDETEELLDASQHQEGDKIRCQLTPHDGELTGAAVWSEEVTIGPAPTLDPPQVAVSPQAPEAGETLTCDVSGIDGEISYTWLLDGEEVQDEDGSTVPGALVEACESWTCRATITGTGGTTPPAEDTVVVAAPAGSAGDIVWYGHHGYEDGGPAPFGVSQWYASEEAATLVDLPADAFPFHLTHVRLYGDAGAQYAVTVYDVAGILPGTILGTASGSGNAGLTILELNEPVVLEQAQELYLSVRGLQDLQTLYGDGDGAETSNMAKACVLFCLMGPPTWKDLAGLGPPFSSMGDIILDAGTATGAEGESTCP